MADSKFDSVARAVELENVYTKQVSNGTKTLWVAVADGKEWTTLQSPLGEKAKSMIGQIVDLQVSIQQKGNYTNYYLNGIQLAPGAAQPSAVAQAAQKAQAASQGPEVTYEQYKDLTEGQEARKNLSIHRQVAAKVSAQLLPESSQEFWANVNDLVEFFQNGNNPFFPQAGQGNAANASGNYTTSVTSHTAPADEYQHSDDDIPF